MRDTRLIEGCTLLEDEDDIGKGDIDPTLVFKKSVFIEICFSYLPEMVCAKV